VVTQHEEEYGQLNPSMTVKFKFQLLSRTDAFKNVRGTEAGNEGSNQRF